MRSGLLSHFVLATIARVRLCRPGADPACRRVRLRRHRHPARHRRRDQQALRRSRALGGGDRAVQARRAGYPRDHRGHLQQDPRLRGGSARLRRRDGEVAPRVLGPGRGVPGPRRSVLPRVRWAAPVHRSRPRREPFTGAARARPDRRQRGPVRPWRLDRCLARSADSIWARDGSYLHRWCVENRVARTPFTSLDGVARAVAAFPA